MKIANARPYLRHQLAQVLLTDAQLGGPLLHLSWITQADALFPECAKLALRSRAASIGLYSGFFF